MSPLNQNRVLSLATSLQVSTHCAMSFYIEVLSYHGGHNLWEQQMLTLSSTK